MRDRTRLALNAFLVAVALLAAGCCERYKCAADAAEITVRDQAGVLPPSTSVNSGGAIVMERCRPNGQCTFPIPRVGTTIVSAPGYRPVQLAIELKMDDCGNMLTQQIEVMLVPEGSADQPVIKVGQALGCG